MSQPWEPPGQQPQPASEPPAASERGPQGLPGSASPASPANPEVPTGPGPQPTKALPPTYPGPGAQPYPGPASPYAGYPGSPNRPYTPPPYAGGPPPGAAPGYPGYQQGYPQYGGYQPYAQPVATSGATTVTASVIQLVQSTFWLVVGIVLMVSAHDVASLLDTSQFDSDATEAGTRGALIGAGVFVALVAGGMITLAVLALRRVNGCRIASGVVQIVFGLLPLVGLLRAASEGDAAGVVFSLLFVASCAAAAALFLMPTSARYCQRNAARPPGY